MSELISFCVVLLLVSVAVVVPFVIALRQPCPRCSAALLLLSDFVPEPGPRTSAFSAPGPSSGWSRYRCTGCKAEFWRYMRFPGIGGELISAERFDPSLQGFAKPDR